MESILECPICMEEYTEIKMPSTIPCGHTFCLDCCKTLRKGNTIKCPLDKKDHAVKEFSKNFTMFDIILEKRREVLELNKTNLDLIKHEKELEQAHKKKLEQAIIETDQKHKLKLERKLRHREAKIKMQFEKELKRKREAEEAENLKKIEKLTQESQNKLKKENEAQLKLEQERLKKLAAEKEEKMRKEMEEKLKADRLKLEKESEELKKKQMAEIEKTQQKLVEEANRIKKEAELELARQQEQVRIEKELLQKKMQREIQEKLEMMEKEASQKRREIELREEIKQESDKKLEKAQAKIQENIRRGKYMPNGEAVERNQRECMQRNNGRIYWAFKSQGKNYMEYFENLSGIIERAFLKGQPSVYLRNRGTVDFIRWIEVKDSGEEIMIKRVNSMPGKAVWKYQSESGWIELEIVDQFEIEKAWLSKNANCMIMNGKFCDFNTLRVNINGKERALMREISKNN